MLKAANSVWLLIFLAAASCTKTKTEKEEASFWNSSVVDSSYRLLYKKGDITTALRYFDSVLEQSGDITIYPRVERFRLIANYHYFFTADNSATALLIDSALNYLNTPGLQNNYPRTYVGLLLFGGKIAYRLNQYSKANEYYFRAKKIGDKHLDPCERTAFNYSIAMVAYRQQHFAASAKYFKEAYQLQQSCAQQTMAVILQQQEIQSNIGLCFVQLRYYDSALVHFNKALAIAEQHRDSLGPRTLDKIYGVVQGHKAQVAMAKSNWREAEKLSIESIALNDREGYEPEHALGIKLQLAEIYSRKKEFNSMFRVLNGVASVIKANSTKKQMEWSRLMASYYERSGQHDSAIRHLKNYFTLGDTIDQEQKQLTAADVTRQLRDKEQTVEINLLRKENELALVWLWAIIIFSMLTLCIIYLIYQHYRRSKASLANSLALNEEIKRQKSAREKEASQRHKLITEAVIRAQENERSLIGLELHDNVNQVLTTIKLHNEMVLEGVSDPKTVLPRTLNYLQDCINEIRSLSKRLSAPTLGKISLEDSVQDLINSINQTSKVKISREIAGFDGLSLHKDLHVGVYRILQEQLNNVLKHADASEVSVNLQRHEETIRLTIKDNGKGFSVNNRNQGIGLVNMQTRAENLNGTFALTSQPGNGCEVKVILPCIQ